MSGRVAAGTDGPATCHCEDLCGWAAAMALTYFKRFRMEIDLARCQPIGPDLPGEYRMVPWSRNLVGCHAEAKYLSFRWEIDADVFPCLGELIGCVRLMDEIRHKEGFLPGCDVVVGVHWRRGGQAGVLWYGTGCSRRWGLRRDSESGRDAAASPAGARNDPDGLGPGRFSACRAEPGLS